MIDSFLIFKTIVKEFVLLLHERSEYAKHSLLPH